jgi:hypothetical protein
VAKLQEQDLGLYLYDVRPDGVKEFLGAAYFQMNETSTVVSFPEEVDYASLRTMYDEDRFYEDLVPIASGLWSAVVVPAIDDTYDT